jgi:hypothetical protein
LSFALYSPLEIYFEFGESTTIDKIEGNIYNYKGKIKNIILKSGDKEIKDDIGKNIVFNLAHHGEWPEEYEYIYDQDQLIGLKLTYKPEDGFPDSEIELGCRKIAQYSVMLTSFFAKKTVKENEIIKLLYSGKPTNVTSLIPYEYNNPDLPIIRIKVIVKD